MEFAILASGSGGNSIVVKSGDQVILIDAGLALSVLKTRLEKLGIDAEEITDVVLTHGHIDHVRGARRGHLYCGWQVWATKGCVGRHKPLAGVDIKYFVPGENIGIEGFNIQTALVSHDAPDTVALRIVEAKSGASLSVVTDLGRIDEGVSSLMRETGALIIETNHDPYKLARGSYPPALKARVLSDLGHLSNKQGAEACLGVMHDHLQWIILAHLSEENNDATLALNVVKDTIAKCSWRGQVRVAWPDRPTGWFKISGPGVLWDASAVEV